MGKHILLQGPYSFGRLRAPGPLADQVFEPLMREGGALANTMLGALLETGSGRGIGLLYVLSEALVILISGIAYPESPYPPAGGKSAGRCAWVGRAQGLWWSVSQLG